MCHSKPTATIFVAKAFDNKRRPNNNNNFPKNRGPNLNLTCTNCNKPGHTVDRCYELIGYPAGYVKRNFNAKPTMSNNASDSAASADVLTKNSGNDNKTSNSPVSLTSDQLSRLMNLLNDSGVSSDNSSMGGNILKTIKGTFFNNNVKFNLNFKKFYNGNTIFLVENISLGWITDSGANQHMTVSTKFLVNVVDVLNLGLTVGHPNGTQALITKIGDLKVNNDITLYDVLVVHEYTVSLLFVHKLARDSKMFVGFDENKCYFQDLKTNKTMGIGRQCNGLYLFDIDKTCKIISNNCIATCYVSRSLWHQRLGHPADQVLNVLNKSLNLDSQSVSDHLCDTCNKAKQTREPFSLSDHKSTKIGQLVHLDVWGPYKITSRDGFRYFLTVVDDYSRAVWTYMLKGKDDVYDSIVNFVNMLSNQFETNVKVFRSDNGSEFVNNRLQSLTPSSVLTGKSPFYLVYGHDPSLSHLRVFGCLCYATILNNQDKFLASRPNDDGRVSLNDDGTELNPEHQDDSKATYMSENTPLEGNVSNETNVSTKTDSAGDINDSSEAIFEIGDLPVKYGVEKVVNYANLDHDSFCFASSLNRSVEPSCYEHAILDNNWIDAMNSEIEALNKNHTWIITDLPPNRKPIKCKWIYKIKYKSSEDIERYKARLVAKGFSQREGIDFYETFSPVVKMTTVGCVIALSVENKWPLFQLDVNNAFLYGDLDEEIYMTIPQGFSDKDNKGKVCKLVKSLYGLKQAPRKWNEKHVGVLKDHGVTQSLNDHSLFTLTKKDKFIALLIYVDDIVITGNCVGEINECKPASTLMEPNSVLPYVPTDSDPLLDNITGYQQLLGIIFRGLSVIFGFSLLLDLPFGLMSLPSVPDAYGQSLEALLTQPAASESESHVPDDVSE
ncbi:ribonuclease H-like domain-containing protein [Tanacetum coccineum]